jgi:outer membrane protein
VKRSIWVAMTVAVAGALVMATAQADIKVGVVSMERLIKESPQGKVVEDALRNEATGKQRELLALQASLKAKQEKLDKDGPTMTADQRAKSDKELREGSRDLNQKASDYQEELTSRQNEELSRLQNAMVAEVQSYALAQKFDLVMASGVVFASNTLDVTTAVLAQLQAKGPVAAPAAAPAAAPKPAPAAAPKPAGGK